MIQHLEIIGVHATVDDKLRVHIDKKIGRLDRFMPRLIRASAHAEVRLKETKNTDRNQFTCEVTLHLPHDVLNVSESTINMYAAVDIVEAKLKQQIVKYKQMHASGALRRHSVDKAAKRPVA